MLFFSRFVPNGKKISQLLEPGTIAFHLIVRYIRAAPPQRGMALGGIQTDKYMQNKAEACFCFFVVIVFCGFFLIFFIFYFLFVFPEILLSTATSFIL